MDFANPSYIQSDYMSGGEQIAGDAPSGSVLHPNTKAKFRNQGFREQEIEAHRQFPYHYQVTREDIPNATSSLPYFMRSDVAPYTLNYPYANNSYNLAYTPFGGLFDATFSSQATPFKTALVTSSLILVGAVIGEMTLGNLIGNKVDKFYKKQKLPVGMGALVGGVTANAIRMGVAGGISGGWKPALTSLLGGMLPVSVPIALTYFGDPKITQNKTKIALGLGGVGFMAVPFIIKLYNK
jgi:hypothetical protein